MREQIERAAPFTRGNLNTDVEVADTPDFAQLLFNHILPNQALSVNTADISMFNNRMDAVHFVLYFSFLLTLIGKRLDSKNYPNWIFRRKRSFILPLGLSPNDPVIENFIPHMASAEAFNTDVKVFWQVRMIFFLNTWAVAKNLSSSLRERKPTEIKLKKTCKQEDLKVAKL